MQHDVFISYSTKDKRVADALVHYLEERRIGCWIAPRDIAGGAEYADVIVGAIETTRIVLVLFSDAAQHSQWVRSEINRAMTLGKVIIPVKIADVIPEKGMGLYLGDRHWVDIYPDLETNFCKVLPAVCNALGTGDKGIGVSERPVVGAGYVICPECGRYNLPTDTFRCKVCGRDFLCIGHQSLEYKCCIDCAEKQSRKTREAVSTPQIKETSPQINSPAPKVVAANDPRPGEEMTIALPGDVQMTFCWCPATTSEAWKRISGGKDYFLMGSLWSEKGRDDNEEQHRVTLTQGFWMGKYEVTQRQWRSIMGMNSSQFEGDDHPVEHVAWRDCQSFIKRINMSGQAVVSLPTEAQWEYACRAGTSSPFSFGETLNGDRANCDGNFPYGRAAKGRCLGCTSRVGAFEPNDWGLFDMHGNVYEWCLDYFKAYSGDATDPTGPESGFFRVCRGGCWNGSAQDCRSAKRLGREDFFPGDYVGVRLVCITGSRR